MSISSVPNQANCCSVFHKGLDSNKTFPINIYIIWRIDLPQQCVKIPPWNLSSQPLHLFCRLRPQMSANVAIISRKNVAIISGKADAHELVPAAQGTVQRGELSLDLLKNIPHWPLFSSTKAFSQNILLSSLRSKCDLKVGMPLPRKVQTCIGHFLQVSNICLW